MGRRSKRHNASAKNAKKANAGRWANQSVPPVPAIVLPDLPQLVAPIIDSAPDEVMIIDAESMAVDMDDDAQVMEVEPALESPEEIQTSDNVATIPEHFNQVLLPNADEVPNQFIGAYASMLLLLRRVFAVVTTPIYGASMKVGSLRKIATVGWPEDWENYFKAKQFRTVPEYVSADHMDLAFMFEARRDIVKSAASGMNTSTGVKPFLNNECKQGGRCKKAENIVIIWLKHMNELQIEMMLIWLCDQTQLQFYPTGDSLTGGRGYLALIGMNDALTNLVQLNDHVSTCASGISENAMSVMPHVSRHPPSGWDAIGGGVSVFRQLGKAFILSKMKLHMKSKYHEFPVSWRNAAETHV